MPVAKALLMGFCQIARPKVISGTSGVGGYSRHMHKSPADIGLRVTAPKPVADMSITRPSSKASDILDRLLTPAILSFHRTLKRCARCGLAPKSSTFAWRLSQSPKVETVPHRRPIVALGASSSDFLPEGFFGVRRISVAVDFLDGQAPSIIWRNVASTLSAPHGICRMKEI